MLGLSLAIVVASCGQPLSPDAIAFDQLQLVRNCGFAPRNCDEFFGPQGFEQAYSRVLGKLSPGDQEADSLPGNLFQFAYYKNMRRVDDHNGAIAIIEDTASGKATLLDVRNKEYAHVRDAFLAQMKQEWSTGQAVMGTVNPEYWLPTRPRSVAITNLPPQTISGIPSKGRSIAVTLDWKQDVVLYGRATARVDYTLFEANGLLEPCPTFHMGSLSEGGPVMGFCRPEKKEIRFVTYFYRNVVNQNEYANMYPYKLIVERGHIRTLGANDLQLFKIPDGYRDACSFKSSGVLSTYC